jgi:hypothetical protein
MASLDDLKAWFERDVQFASWNNNVRVDQADPRTWLVRFYTDTNEYCLRITERDDGTGRINGTVRSRKPRAGLSGSRARPLLPEAPLRLNEWTWRRTLAAIVGAELVRVHRREPVEADTGSAAV